MIVSEPVPIIAQKANSAAITATVFSINESGCCDRKEITMRAVAQIK